jgi:hypothetical protein
VTYFALPLSLFSYFLATQPPSCSALNAPLAAIEYFSPLLAPARNILKADIVFEKGLAEFDIAPAIK